MEKKLNYLFCKNAYNIYVLRHPEVENHKENVFNGTIDVDLSLKGYEQTDELFEFFEGKGIKRVYTSPLKRCKVVAEKFEGICDVVVDNRLRERSFGVFESMSWEKIEKVYSDDAKAFLKDPFYYRPKGGESFYDVELRVKDFMDAELKSLSGDVLIVAHGGVNRVFIANFLGIDRNFVLRISQDYACINHFLTDGDFVLVKLLNGKVCLSGSGNG